MTPDEIFPEILSQKPCLKIKKSRIYQELSGCLLNMVASLFKLVGVYLTVSY